MKKLLLISALFLSAFIGCKKDSVPTIQNTTSKLLGKWNWISTGTIYPVGSQEYMAQISNSTYEILEGGSLNINYNGNIFLYHWKLLDPSTLQVEETGQVYTIATLDKSNLKLSYESIKNINGKDVPGITSYYFTKVVTP